MKRFSRLLICTVALAALLCLPSAAAASDNVSVAAPAAPTVLLNGNEVDFTDAAPKIVDGRTVIPFRGVFNALGFADETIGWDNDTRSVYALREDVTISLTIGEKAVTVTRDGVDTQFQTDVAPFIDAATSRTYVPARFVAEALGYRVGWDAISRVVIIDDVEAILAANTETYAIADAYLKYSAQFAQDAWTVTGAYDMDMTMAGEAIQMDGSYYMLTKGLAMEYEMAMKLSGSALEGADGAIPSEINIALMGDLEDGVFYFKSDEMTAMMGMAVSNTWFKLDLAAIMDSMQELIGMDYAQLINLSNSASTTLSFQEYLEALLRTMPLTSSANTTSVTLAWLNAMMGDSAYTKSGNDYTATLTDPNAGATVKMTFTTDAQGDVVGYSVGMSVQQGDMVAMNMEMAMTGLEMDMNMTMSADLGEGMAMEMEMTMDGTYEKSTKTPTVVPSSEAAVIDLMEMMGAL